MCSFFPLLKHLIPATNMAYFHLFFEAEKHAGISCVTASMDDILFEDTAR